MQQLLVADGQLVLAGAAHLRSWPNGDGSCGGGHEDALAGNRSHEMEHSSWQGEKSELQPQKSESPVAVLLVRPEDFCHPQCPPTAHRGGNQHASVALAPMHLEAMRQQQQQQQQREPMGDLVLRRWLLKVAGVRVVEVGAEEWAQVMHHEAAAALLLSEALQQQKQQQP